MDTPGLLWPKLDNAIYAQRLAFLGSVKDDIMDVEELAALLLTTLQQKCPDALQKRYKALLPETPKEELLIALSKSRGFLLRAASRIRKEAHASRLMNSARGVSRA